MSSPQKGTNFLMESDLVSLSSSLMVVDNYLIDNIVNAQHVLDPRAVNLIELINRQPKLLVSWKKDSLKLGLSIQNFEEIINFINRIGGFEIKSRVMLWPPKNFIKNLHRSLTKVTRRLSPTLWSVAAGCSLAAYPFYILSFLSIWSLLFINVSLKNSLVISLSTLVVILMSMVVHEYAHLLVLKKYGKKAVVIQRSTNIGILHQKLNSSKGIFYTALSGPMAGMVISLALGYCMSSLFSNSVFYTIAMIIGLFHLISLLPAFGDGQAVINSIKVFRDGR